MNIGYHEHLSAFVMIAKSRSLTRASAVTGTGQSTLSRQLAALEKPLGCKLFHRSTRSIKLTEKGEIFLAHAERILQAAAAAADAKDLLREGEGGFQRPAAGGMLDSGRAPPVDARDAPMAIAAPSVGAYPRRPSGASTMNEPRVASIHVGKIAPLGPDGVPSGFVKHRVSGAVEVTSRGIVGDEQADLRVHGGPDKAVYGYASAHYAEWRREYPQHTDLLVAGGLGENLSIDAMTEADLCVGDVHGIGTARLQVCQPRQPCFKFALRFGDRLMPRAMIRNGRSGWYYRILIPGVIAQGDRVVALERPHPSFAFTRLVELITHRNATLGELQQMKSMQGLALDWQQRAAEALGALESKR